jgi:hypothetical protein
MTEVDLGRLYDPVGTIDFDSVASIIDEIAESIKRDDSPGEIKKAKLVLLANVRSHISSHIEQHNAQPGD